MFHLSARGLAALVISCIIPNGIAATNQRITASFQTSEGKAAVILREQKQNSADHYQVRLNDNRLEFVKVEGGTDRLLGVRKISHDQSYGDDLKWTISASASGPMISGSLVNEDGTEVTSGTVFDHTYKDGGSRVLTSSGIRWTSPTVIILPQYGTSSAKIRNRYDVIVAGAGTAGSMAAIQAARLGSSVLVVEETDWIGGQMAAAAVTSMDEGAAYPEHGVDRDGVRERGLYREFFERANHLYDTIGISRDTCYITEDHFGTEPGTAQALLYEMFQHERISAGATLDVTLETSITKVLKSGDSVTGVELLIHTPDGNVPKKISSKILIDATEYGDILPMAGARYRVSNLISDNINMDAAEHAPVQHFTWTAVIKEYPDGPPDNLMLKVPPKGYNAASLKLAVDNPRATTSTSPWSWQRFIAYRGMPDTLRRDSTIKNPWAKVTKTHMNVGANDHHVSAADVENLEKRLEKEYELKLKTLQLLYFIQNDLTEPMRNWTVAIDEAFNTPYNREQNRRLIELHPDMAPFEDILNLLPPMPYARESRRMIGVHTIKAREIDRRNGPMVFPTSVAVGDYPVDLHGSDSPSELELELDNPEDVKAIGFSPAQVGPFTIPFEAFIPEKLDGFLASEKNISQSRLVNGATRLQPSTMLIGQATGAIAGLAVKENMEPRELHPAAIQKVLLEAGDVLFATRFDTHKFPGIEQGTDLWNSLQLCLLYGVVDLEDARQHLSGFQIVSGATGEDGWYVNEKNALQFAGNGTGLGVFELPNQKGFRSGDYTVTATLVQAGDSGAAGVIGRYIDKGNFHHARLFQGNLELLKWEGNKPVLLTKTPAELQPGLRANIALQLDGSKITASLNGEKLGYKEISVVDSTHTTGSAGLRVQPGGNYNVEFASAEVTLPNGGTAVSLSSDFRQPTNFATDPLTRAQFAVYLARYLNLLEDTPADKATYADVPLGHPAFAAIEALHSAGFELSSHTSEEGFKPAATLTTEDMKGALTKLRIKIPANLTPGKKLTIGDSLNLFADLIVSPPAGLKTISEKTEARPMK